MNTKEELIDILNDYAGHPLTRYTKVQILSNVRDMLMSKLNQEFISDYNINEVKEFMFVVTYIESFRLYIFDIDIDFYYGRISITQRK